MVTCFGSDVPLPSACSDLPEFAYLMLWIVAIASMFALAWLVAWSSAHQW